MTFPVRPEHVKASGDLLADRMQTDHALNSARHFWASLLRGLPLFLTTEPWRQVNFCRIYLEIA